MRRDFLLELSTGFIYDCLNWGLARLSEAGQRRLARKQFSGYLSVDELHLGDFTLLLATDPIADLPVGFALVSRNDADHMCRFLKNLKTWGLEPKVVVTDGSTLYPALLAQLWPAARHQLCVFHLLKDINDLILQAVRRLAHALKRRGNAGRRRQRGRPSKAQQAARALAGPTVKEKAGFILKHRFLIVKKTGDLDKQQWDHLIGMFDYLPQLRTLWHFACAVRGLFEKEARVQTLWKRRQALLKNEQYQTVTELVEAMAMLEAGKFQKAVAFVYSEAAQKVRTNNHVERANRRFRFTEKLRYKWRRRKWVLRFVLLALDRWWREVAAAEITAGKGHSTLIPTTYQASLRRNSKGA